MTKLDTSGFTGSETWFRHSLARNFVYTEGVKYVADEAGAYWLLDVIFSWQSEPKVAAEEFQVWTLRVAPDKSATVEMGDGNGRSVVCQLIESTDFPQDSMVMWLENKTLYLPSEH